jgi:predicted MFS family arabinose efflux permease
VLRPAVDEASGWGSPALVRATHTLSATQVISWGILFYGFAVIAPAMRDDTGWSTGATAGAFAVGLTVAGLAAPAVARLLRRYGPRRVMASGSVLGALGMAAWATAPNLVVLYAAWAMIGAAMAATLYEPAVAILVTLDPARRQRTLTAVTVAGGLASTLFAPLTALLVDHMSWRSTAALLGITGGVATLLLHLVGLPARLGHSTPHADSTDTPPVGGRAIRALTIATVVEQAAQIAATTHLVALLIARDVSTGTAAAVLAVMGLGKVAGRLLLIGRLGRLPLTRLAAACAAGQLIAFAVPLATTGRSALFAAGIAAGAAAGAMTVVRSLLVVDLAGVDAFATVNARLARVGAFARAGGPAALGAAVAPLGWTASWLMILTGYAVAAERYARLGQSSRPRLRPSARSSVSADDGDRPAIRDC